jgi:WD40 repeat protein
VALLRGHDDAAFNVSWSPDGSQLASSGRDRTIRIWNWAEETEVAVLRGHQDGIWGIAWSFDGARLVTAADDRTVRLWDAATSPETALDRAERRAIRPLTTKERQLFMLPEQPPTGLAPEEPSDAAQRAAEV